MGQSQDSITARSSLGEDPPRNRRAVSSQSKSLFCEQQLGGEKCKALPSPTLAGYSPRLGLWCRPVLSTLSQSQPFTNCFLHYMCDNTMLSGLTFQSICQHKYSRSKIKQSNLKQALVIQLADHLLFALPSCRVFSTILSIFLIQVSTTSFNLQI